jgi:hypothetical protein
VRRGHPCLEFRRTVYFATITKVFFCNIVNNDVSSKITAQPIDLDILTHTRCVRRKR